MLYFISWLTDFALLLFIFAGTRYVAEESGEPIVMGLLGAAFFAASAVSNAWSGRVADRLGRRPVALCGAGMLLASLAGVASCSADHWLFYALYSSVGFSVGLIYPPIMAWLGQGRRGHAASRTFLLFCLAFNLGIVCAQVSGGLMFDRLGPQVPLQVAMGLTAVSFFCLLILREPTDAGKPSPTMESGEEDERTRLARAFARMTWIANFGGMFSMSVLWFLFPLMAVSLNIHAELHGVILAIGRIVVMSTYCLMHFYPIWHYRFRVTALAQLFGAVGLLVIGVADSPLALTIGVAALSLVMGYNYFASLFYNASGNANERKGRAFGLNEASLGFGAAAGSLTGGLAGADYGIRSPFLLAASLMTVLLLVQAVVYWKLVRPLRSAGRPLLRPEGTTA